MTPVKKEEKEGFVYPHATLSINEPFGSNVLSRELPPGSVNLTPVLTAIAPIEATIGGADVTLVCTGSNFLQDSIITFNGGDEVTTFVNRGQLTTIVKPSTATTPGTYPVTVKHSGGESAPQGFTFHPVEEGDDPDEIEDELEQMKEEGEISSKHAPPKRRR